MNKDYNNFFENILTPLKNLYDISSELGDEAVRLILKYQSKRTYERFRQEALREMIEEDGCISIKKFKEKMHVKRCIDSVKDFDDD